MVHSTRSRSHDLNAEPRSVSVARKKLSAARARAAAKQVAKERAQRRAAAASRLSWNEIIAQVWNSDRNDDEWQLSGSFTDSGQE